MHLEERFTHYVRSIEILSLLEIFMDRYTFVSWYIVTASFQVPKFSNDSNETPQFLTVVHFLYDNNLYDR